MPSKPLILDTDIGTDVDDLIALSLILNSPELELIGVTTVYGDVALRARMVRKLLACAAGTTCPWRWAPPNRFSASAPSTGRGTKARAC